MPLLPTCLGPLFVDDQGTADEPAALLWPSLFTDHSMWHQQVPALRRAGYRTLALDPPGHGQSPGPGRRFTMDECAAAALQVLNACNVQTPVVVLGTSWGGFVAPRLALLAPGRVRGLVLFNTSAQRPLPGQWAKAQLLVNLLRFRLLDGLTNGIITSSLLASATRQQRPQVGTELLRQLRGWDRRRTNRTVRAVLLERAGFLDRLPSLAQPVLLVSGAQDTILPTKLSKNMMARLPHARHVEVPGAAHLVPLDASEAATKLILEFVRELPAPNA